jgi:hypothetical protein
MKIVEEMMKYKSEIQGISETKMKGTGEIRSDKNYELRYSDVDKMTKGKEGAIIIISEELNRNVPKWIAINSSLIRLDIELKGEKTTFIQIYTPMED